MLNSVLVKGWFDPTPPSGLTTRFLTHDTLFPSPFRLMFFDSGPKSLDISAFFRYNWIHTCMYPIVPEKRAPIMRRTKEEALLTREQVLRAALRVFSSQGYAASTL